jgi:uncharacterized protein YneF (UPF0154 family)
MRKNKELCKKNLCGLSALFISKLMGISYYLAKKRLRKVLQEQGKITEDDIANLIVEARNENKTKNSSVIDKYLSPTIPYRM